MMIPKIVADAERSRRKILEGFRIVHDAVAATYSPMSGNVSIEKNWGNPVVSHDGVTVARSISLADSEQNAGARLLIEASEQTNKVAGDGTSATVILGYHLVDKANKLIAANYNPMEIRRGMDRAAIDIINVIDEIKRPVTPKDARNIAAVSAGSVDLGHLIADTINEVGNTAGVTVEESQTTIVESEVVEGFYFGRGLDSPYMMNEPDMRRAVHDDVWIIPLDAKWRDVSDIRGFLEFLAEKTDKRNVLIVGDVQNQALNAFVMNTLKGLTNVVSVAIPVMGSQKQEFLRDLAIVSGGQVVTEDFDWEDEDITDKLGWADRVVVTDSTTTIIGAAGEKKDVDAREATLQKQLKTMTDATQVERMESRIAKLNGKVGIIRVGAPTETDRKEKMMRVDDAVMATRAALEDGMVAGGATTLLRIGASFASKNWPGAQDLSADAIIGYRMVFEAIQEPFRTLLHNAGLEDVGYEKRTVVDASQGWGYNVRDLNKGLVDLFEEGIVDPAKVVKQAVINSVANAGLAITMGAIVTQDVEEMRKNNQEV